MTHRRSVVRTIAGRRVWAPDSNALLGFVAEVLQRHIERDGGLQATCASLLRSGRSLRVRVDLTQGEAPPRVTVARLPMAVPEWSETDHELLRSLGISCEPLTPSAAPEPGRRQPR